MTERRRFLRFETALSALCDIASAKWKACYKVINISKEGALLIIDRKLKSGDEVRLSMNVPGDNVPVYASGRVAWQKESNSTNQFDTGISFTSLDCYNKGRLFEYIYSQWLRLLDKE